LEASILSFQFDPLANAKLKAPLCNSSLTKSD
jgi:hypothetical protein